jgi:hypothetical protein
MSISIVGKEIREDWDGAMVDPTVIEMFGELSCTDIPQESDFGFMVAARDEYRKRTGKGYVTMGAVSRALIRMNNERLVDMIIKAEESVESSGPRVNREEALERMNSES